MEQTLIVAGVAGVISTAGAALEPTAKSFPSIPAPAVAVPVLTGGDIAVLLYGDVDASGTVAAVQAPLCEHRGGILKPLQFVGDNDIPTGTTAHVSDTAAGLLNRVFSIDAVTAVLPVGVAIITAEVE